MSKKYFCGNSSVLFSFFGLWAKAFWPFVGKLLAGLLKLHSEVRCHSFCEKHYVCERTILVLAVLDTERVSFAASLKTFWRYCDNCIECVQKNIYTNDNFFEKQMIWYFFQTLSWMFWRFVKRLSARLLKLLSPCSYEHFFKKIFSKKSIVLFFFLGPWAIIFWPFVGNFSTKLWKLLRCAHKNTSSLFFWKKYSFWSFFYLERFFWTLCWNFPDEVVKTASYLFIGSFWWEKYFDEETLKFFVHFETFSDKFLAVCWEFFGRFVAIAIYVFIRFSPTEKIFVWKFHIFIISDNDRKISNFVKQFSEGLSKLHSTCA